MKSIPRKMDTDDSILELDYSSQKKDKKTLATIGSYTSLILFFVLLSSYKNPNTRINNELVNTSSNQIQYLLRTQIRTLSEQSLDDTLFNLNNTLNNLLIDFYIFVLSFLLYIFIKNIYYL